MPVSRPIPEDTPAQAARLFALRDELTDTIHENIGELAAQAPQDPADIAVVDHARAIAEAILSTYEVRAKRRPVDPLLAPLRRPEVPTFSVNDLVATSPVVQERGRNGYRYGSVVERLGADASGAFRYLVQWHDITGKRIASDEYDGNELVHRVDGVSE